MINEQPDRLEFLRRAGFPVVVAVVATAVLGASAPPRHRPGGDRAAVAPATTVGERSDAGRVTRAGSGAVRSAATAGAAQPSLRLLIDQAGWRVTAVWGFADESGTIAYASGGRTLEMNWYPAEQYDGFRTDRLEVSSPTPVKIAGWAAEQFRYSASDLAVMLRPRDGAFVEIRMQGAWTSSTFRRVLADIVRVDVRTWLSALPATVVTPDRAAAEAARMLAGVPLPPGFDISAMKLTGTNDQYYFGAAVIGRVGCAWIAAWLRARMVGDKVALQRAGRVLRSSRRWKVLQQLQDEGGWADEFWRIADDVAAGDPPVDYRRELGCA